MALKANRVGVRKDQVDIYGRPISPSFFEALANDLPVWTDLPVWKSGTEQLLPVNDDEPDTSPILCDIEYPVADLKNNQHFIYRQSPTQKDGKAKIRGVRGKTLVWNQLQRNNAETQTVNEMVFTNNGDGSWKVNGTCTQFTQKSVGLPYAQGVVGHKYLFMGCPKMTLPEGVSLCPYINGAAAAAADRDYGDGKVLECTVAGSIYCLITISNANTTLNNVVFHPMIIDLTLLGVSTVTDKASFQQLFPLPSYAFNLGSLLDFTGTKVKTTGKNIISSMINGSSNGITSTVNSDGTIKLNGTSTSVALMRIAEIVFLPNVEYRLIGGYSSNVQLSIRLYTGSSFDSSEYTGSLTNSGSDVTKFKFKNYTVGYLYVRVANGQTVSNLVLSPMITFGDADISFEPYKSNETDLPISTFFPTGMKSAGAVYDELTPTKAITRIGAVDLGSLTWTYDSANTVFRGAVSDIKRQLQADLANLLCPMYRANTQNQVIGMNADMCISTLNWGDYVVVRNNAYTDADVFKNAMSGVMLNYELAAEIVQPTMSFDSE